MVVKYIYIESLIVAIIVIMLILYALWNYMSKQIIRRRYEKHGHKEDKGRLAEESRRQLIESERITDSGTSKTTFNKTGFGESEEHSSIPIPTPIDDGRNTERVAESESNNKRSRKRIRILRRRRK